MYIFFNKITGTIIVAESVEKFLEIWNEQYFKKFWYIIEMNQEPYLWVYSGERHQSLLFEYKPIKENSMLDFRF